MPICICVCVIWIHKGYCLVEKLVSNATLNLTVYKIGYLNFKCFKSFFRHFYLKMDMECTFFLHILILVKTRPISFLLVVLFYYKNIKYTGWSKKSLWCDLEEKWNYKILFDGVFFSIYSHLLKKVKAF